MGGLDLRALRQALLDIAAGLLDRALRVSARVEQGIREAEEWANEGSKE